MSRLNKKDRKIAVEKDYSLIIVAIIIIVFLAVMIYMQMHSYTGNTIGAI